MADTGAIYLMEDLREAERLAEKVDPAAWVQTYLALHLTDGIRVLDVGCGPGTIAAHVAHTNPTIQIVGLDRSSARMEAATKAFAGLTNAAVQQGDARTLPFKNDVFDLVYTRFLLEYLAEKEQAVAEMTRVCRSGGVVLLQDLDGQLVSNYPSDPNLQAGIEEVLAGLQQRGFDPFVGRKLYHLAYKAGLINLRVDMESYHLIAGRMDEPTRRRWQLKLDIARHSAAQVLGDRKVAALIRRFLAYLDRDDTLTWSQVFTVGGIKP